jgi:acetyltransferase-like isoleucine patch superfamily enzyme
LLIDKDGDVRIGDDVFFNNYCTVCAMKEITIGNGTIFGENVKIYDHNHIYKNPNILIKKQGYTSGSIHIGNHCWIGSNVTILKGVKIGDNCVIGASCVVYRDVPTNSIVLNKQEQIIKVL